MKQIITLFLFIISISSYSQKKDLFYLWPYDVPGERGDKTGPVVDTLRKDGVLHLVEKYDPCRNKETL